MDTRRTSSPAATVFAIVSTLICLLGSGCKGDDSFSGQHMDSIQYDCQQTAACDPAWSSRTDAVAECLEDTASKLDRGSDAVRAMYEMRFSRCAGQSGCDYFNCAGNSMLYSIVNEVKLRYDCMQQGVCKIMSGMPAQPTDNDTCFTALAQQLDFATIPDKASYDQRFERCGMMYGCAYVNCK